MHVSTIWRMSFFKKTILLVSSSILLASKVSAHESPITYEESSRGITPYIMAGLVLVTIVLLIAGVAFKKTETTSTESTEKQPNLEK
jgi:hypothetical protein